MNGEWDELEENEADVSLRLPFQRTFDEVALRLSLPTMAFISKWPVRTDGRRFAQAQD